MLFCFVFLFPLFLISCPCRKSFCLKHSTKNPWKNQHLLGLQFTFSHCSQRPSDVVTRISTIFREEIWVPKVYHMDFPQTIQPTNDSAKIRWHNRHNGHNCHSGYHVDYVFYCILRVCLFLKFWQTFGYPQLCLARESLNQGNPRQLVPANSKTCQDVFFFPMGT